MPPNVILQGKQKIQKKTCLIREGEEGILNRRKLNDFNVLKRGENPLELGIGHKHRVFSDTNTINWITKIKLRDICRFTVSSLLRLGNRSIPRGFVWFDA